MKSLYESILGSTNSGKDKIIREKIQAWIDTVSSEQRTSSFFGHNHKNKFVINTDLSVSYRGNLYLDMCFNKDGGLQEIIEIPDYISFDTIEGDFYVKMYTINKMQNQFPKIIRGNCSIKGNTTYLKDVHICASNITIVNCSLFSKIDNVEIELGPYGHFIFSDSSLKLEEFKKIKFVNDNLESIDCSNTPMGDELLKTRNKFFKKEDMGGFKEYMKEIVPKTKFPYLLKIVIKPKRKLLDSSLQDWWVLTDQYGKWVTK